MRHRRDRPDDRDVPLGASFGLGLLFLLAGYFVPRSYDRKGAGRFLKERWLRIGLPLVVFVLLVHRPVVYPIESPRPPFGDFVRSLYDSGWLNMYLHVWFMGHLLLYSAGYVIWRRVADRYSDRCMSSCRGTRRRGGAAPWC